MKHRKFGFTLIELITVIAITTILLAIISVPLIQSFNVTRAAQSFADAQNRARLLMDQIVREVSNAAFVRDNTGNAGIVTIEIPRSAAATNDFVRLQLENARLDLIAPAQGDPAPAPGGGLINPDTGKVDPTLRTPRGDVNLPATGGFRLVRYFVGLREPVVDSPQGPLPGRYRNPYDGLLNRRDGSPDNLFVLYRAEVDLRTYDPVTNSWRINAELFDLDGSGAATPRELEVALDDPNFFIFNIPLANINDPASVGAAIRQREANRIRGWLRRSRVVTEINRSDMIQVVFDRNTRAVQTFTDPADGQVKPRVISLVEFTPSRVSNEPMAGMQAVRSGEESENAEKIGPDIFTADFGNLSSAFLRVRPSSYRDATNTIVAPWLAFQPWISGRPYLIARNRMNGNVVAGFSQYHFTGGDEMSAGIEVFDSSGYEFAASFDRNSPLPPDPDNPGNPVPDIFRYPFSFAVQRAAGRAGGTNLLNSPALREDFIAMTLDRKAGKMRSSFGIQEVGSTPLPAEIDANRPVSAIGDSLTPTQDPLVIGTAPSSSFLTNTAVDPASTASRINQRFNAVWHNWSAVGGNFDPSQLVRRFIDLRVVPQLDGTPSPLNPVSGFPRARIVPGSEVVVGPDQLAGPNFGRPIRYTRVPVAGNVGPNQYYINYVNQPEPNWTQLGFTVDARIYDPTFYDNTGTTAGRFVSQYLQPRYRVGYIEFNSRFGEPLPAGNISVTYRFQFTEPNDVVEIDYDSRQLINVNLTVRNFAQTTNPNQQFVTVRGQASVRNQSR